MFPVSTVGDSLDLPERLPKAQSAEPTPKLRLDKTDRVSRTNFFIFLGITAEIDKRVMARGLDKMGLISLLCSSIHTRATVEGEVLLSR
jgi:hypothetical protein